MKEKKDWGKYLKNESFFYGEEKQRGKRRKLFGEGKYHDGGTSHTVTQTNRHCEDRARTLDSEFTFLAIKSSSHLGAFGSIS